MTYLEFTSPDFRDRYHHTLQGIHVGRRISGDKKVDLYKVGNFFVEITFPVEDKVHYELCSRREIEAYPDASILKKYSQENLSNDIFESYEPPIHDLIKEISSMIARRIDYSERENLKEPEKFKIEAYYLGPEQFNLCSPWHIYMCNPSWYTKLETAISRIVEFCYEEIEEDFLKRVEAGEDTSDHIFHQLRILAYLFHSRIDSGKEEEDN